MTTPAPDPIYIQYQGIWKSNRTPDGRFEFNPMTATNACHTLNGTFLNLLDLVVNVFTYTQTLTGVRIATTREAQDAEKVVAAMKKAVEQRTLLLGKDNDSKAIFDLATKYKAKYGETVHVVFGATVDTELY